VEKKEYNKQYYLEHKNEKHEYDAKYYLEHKLEKINYSKKYYSEHKSNLLAKRKQFKKNHREYIKRLNKQYFEQNKERILKRKQKQKAKKYHNDPMFRLNNAISANMRGSLRRKKAGKHWEDLVGYTLFDLKKHLELQFKDDMNWQNYGSWQIDHIIPQSWWKFKKCEDPEFKQCWALANLQPLWKEDNLRKGNRGV